MSFVAASSAFSISLYFFLMRLLTLQCVAEPSLPHNAVFVTCRETSSLQSTQDGSAVHGEESLTTSETASPLAAPAKCNTPATSTTTAASQSASESTTTASGKLIAVRRKPAEVRRAACTSDAESSAGKGMRRQSSHPAAIISTANVIDRTSSATAESAVFFGGIPRSLPQATLRAASAPNAAGTAGGYRPPAAASVVESQAEARVLPAAVSEGRATIAPAARAARTARSPPEHAALDAAPAALPAATVRLAEDTAVARVLAASPVVPAEEAAIRAPVPALAASAAVIAGRATKANPSPRILKGHENAVCRHVAVEAQSVCKKVKPTQRTYPCMKQVVEKLCEDVPIVIQKMCTKTYHERKPFKCDRVEYKSECIQKKETTRTECVQTVIKEEAYPCPKVDYVTKCNKKPALTPSVCKHEVQKEFQYPCERTVKEEQCAEVEKEVDQVCEEEVVVPEKYDCSKTVYVKKCSPASGKAATGIRAAGGEVAAPASHRKDDILSQGGEEKAPRRLRKAITTPDAVVVPLPKTQISVEMCVDVPQVKRKTCTREVVKKERRPCKGVKKEIQCSNVTKVIQEVCSTVKKVVEPYACTKTEMQQECSTVAKQVEDTCTREVPVDEKGPCEIEIFKNECIPVPVRIPDVCFETRPKTEIYDCSENSSKAICKEELKEIEQQCIQTEYREVEYACTQLEHVEKCVVPDTTPSIVSTPLPPHKYGKKQHERTYLLPPSEAVDEDEEPQDVEQAPPQAPVLMMEPPMRKEFATVMMAPTAKKTKMKWKEKLHKLGDPDLGEEEKGEEKVQESKTQAEDGDRSKK